MSLRSPRERLLQTLAYEAGGLILSVPLVALVGGGTTAEAFALMLTLSIAVMLWSPLHNTLFDWVDLSRSGRLASDRPQRWRLVHAASHEATTVVVTLPILIWLASLLFIFTAAGLIGQSVIASLFGAPLSAGWAALAACAAALPLNSLAMRPLAAVLPRDETTAITLDDLVRRDAEIQIGTARAGSAARAKVVDVHGQAHFVMVEPHDAAQEFKAGDSVLLVRREGQTFYGVQYESPLLGLSI